MRIGSLFSGIGGLDLGLEWSGVGRTVFQVEIDPYCRSVLARHWPDVPRYEDVRTVDCSELPRCELLCGGFPCTDLSVANRSPDGLSGARSGLWTDMLRITKVLRPSWVVVGKRRPRL